MKKMVFWTLFVVLATVFIGFTILSAKTDPSDEFAPYQRPHVQFLENYHDQHMENQDCLECHHKYENGKNILDEADLEDDNVETSCASCHDNQDNHVKYNLQQAFHRQCIGCHDRLSSANMKIGPILCGECHIRTKTG
ncbi:MAG: cytochrome c3 family protein [Deltaproteobacteria bacterium]|nr:cytochrome c3 family protein [Deltaproteobacteria bacterium]